MRMGGCVVGSVAARRDQNELGKSCVFNDRQVCQTAGRMSFASISISDRACGWPCNGLNTTTDLKIAVCFSLERPPGPAIE